MEKHADLSIVERSELVLPNDTNLLGNLMGGRLMHSIDVVGAIAATKHAGHIVATAAMDHMDFRHPIKMGDLVTLCAKVIWTGRTSIQVRVKVYAENMITGTKVLSNKAYITYVALDSEGKPTPVPKVIVEDPEDIADFEKTQKLYLERKQKEKNNK
ncbi:MAG: acyl-CoA thioesterase [Clostridiaceae bacterium]|nr:acyl-CoA thioesterase [Clostridiaceae bacterium]